MPPEETHGHSVRRRGHLCACAPWQVANPVQPTGYGHPVLRVDVLQEPAGVADSVRYAVTHVFLHDRHETAGTPPTARVTTGMADSHAALLVLGDLGVRLPPDHRRDPGDAFLHLSKTRCCPYRASRPMASCNAGSSSSLGRRTCCAGAPATATCNRAEPGSTWIRAAGALPHVPTVPPRSQGRPAG
jgi:hypothetical protein